MTCSSVRQREAVVRFELRKSGGGDAHKVLPLTSLLNNLGQLLPIPQNSSPSAIRTEKAATPTRLVGKVFKGIIHQIVVATVPGLSLETSHSAHFTSASPLILTAHCTVIIPILQMREPGRNCG